MRNLWPISCLPRPCQLSHKTIYVDQVPVVVQYNTCPCISGSQGLWMCCSVRFIVLIWPLSSSHRNPFCVLKVDNEAVARSVAQLPDALPRLLSRKSMMFYFRTATVYRTLEPFWGEEYTLHVPNEFQAVSVHVFDHDLMGYVM